MELAVTVIGALVSLATLAFKWWKARKDASNAEADLKLLQSRLDHLEDENATLRKLVAEKETKLAETLHALAAKLSAGELAAALTGVFRREQTPAGRGPLEPGGVPKTGKTGT